MKGLLIKDFGLLKGQKRFFIVVCALAVGMALLMENTAFALGYLTFLIPSFALSTISYDEFDNGNAFLFTLPISRKIYVIEKYCFTVILGLASMVLSMILALVVIKVNGQTMSFEKLFLTAPLVLAFMLVIQSIMLPIQLKFGAEKGKIAILVGIGFIIAVGYALVNVLSRAGLNPNSAYKLLEQLPTVAVIAGAIVLAGIVMIISATISVAIMEKKEF